MFNLFGSAKIKAFGLDISDISIKVMELSRKDKFLVPTAKSDVPLGVNIIANHMILNEQKLAENMKKALATAGRITTNFVVASVPESKSFVRVVKIPKMTEAEIAGALPFELEQNIPVPIDLVYLDWKLLRELPDNLEVLVTATPKDYIDALVGALKMAGLKPVALELESQAMTRALISPADREADVMIVDISANQTTFVVSEKGTAQYTSSIPVAGNAFTESIARNLGIPLTDAEKAKQTQGLVADIKKGNIRQAILPLLDNIIDEIRNVSKFHDEHSGNSLGISKIILSGGSSRLPGLADYISARLNLGSAHSIGHVELGNPWVNISNPKALPENIQDSLPFATVAGLAMRGVEL